MKYYPGDEKGKEKKREKEKTRKWLFLEVGGVDGMWERGILTVDGVDVIYAGPSMVFGRTPAPVCRR